MNINVLFISEQSLKTGIINQNIDNKLINQNIIDIQNTQILSCIGTGLYNELVDQIKTSAVTSDNRYLLEYYIQPALRNLVTAELIPDITFQLRNGTQSTLEGDTFKSSDIKEVEYNSARYRNRGENYLLQLSKYLCANSNIYPLYSNPGDSSDTIRPDAHSYRSPLAISKKNK